MTISDTYVFNQTARGLIDDALSKLGIGAEGESVTNAIAQSALREMNRLIKYWQTKSTHQWAIQDIVVFPVVGQARYLLGASGTNATLLDDMTFTSLTASFASGASSITVASLTGISDGDNIGIVQNNQTILWTTVNGTPSNLTVTLTDPLTYACSSSNEVYVYTDGIQRPLRVIQGRLRKRYNSEMEMMKISLQEYNRISNKNSPTVTQYYYEPTMTNGTLKVYGVPALATDLMYFTVDRALSDVNNLTDTLDLPQEWHTALVYNIAYFLAPQYGIDVNIGDVKEIAIRMQNELLNWDQQNLGFQLRLERGYNYGFRR